MKIVNTSDTADKLVNAHSNVSSRTELVAHEEDDGVMQQKRVGFIEIPAKGSKLLNQDGSHVNLVGLKKNLEPGDLVRINLHFQEAGDVIANAPVKAQ